jgi:NAD(P)-dependent dehydrogenase (short-subunit alcohol dehydrogenase family)
MSEITGPIFTGVNYSGGSGTLHVQNKDWTGIATFTGQEIVNAVDRRDEIVDQLLSVLPELNNAQNNLGSIAPFTGALDVSQLGPLPDPMQQFNAPVRPDLSTDFPNAPVLPTVNYSYTEEDYNSILLTEVQAKLIDLVTNARQTGLNPVIEQQLWDRGRERTTAVMQGLVTNIAKQFAAAGWTLPTGDEVDATLQAQEAKAEADITESRNIAVAQADLEQKNLQFGIIQAIAMEAQMMNLFTATRQRALESAKQAVETIISIIKSDIDVYIANIDAQTKKLNATVAVYTADAEVYKTQIEGESTRILADMDIVKAKLEFFTKKVDVDIDAFKANVSLFLAQKELILKAKETETQLLAQVAASIGGAVNFGASMSASTGYSNTPLVTMGV